MNTKKLSCHIQMFSWFFLSLLFRICSKYLHQINIEIMEYRRGNMKPDKTGSLPRIEATLKKIFKIVIFSYEIFPLSYRNSNNFFYTICMPGFNVKRLSLIWLRFYHYPHKLYLSRWLCSRIIYKADLVLVH